MAYYDNIGTSVFKMHGRKSNFAMQICGCNFFKVCQLIEETSKSELRLKKNFSLMENEMKFCSWQKLTSNNALNSQEVFDTNILLRASSISKYIAHVSGRSRANSVSVAWTIVPTLRCSHDINSKQIRPGSDSRSGSKCRNLSWRISCWTYWKVYS